jgi:hypothetical protein
MNFFFHMQFDLDNFDDVSSGLQWLEGKKSLVGKGRKKSSRKGRRSSHGLETSVEEDLLFPGFGGGEEEEEDDVATKKLQVRSVKRLWCPAPLLDGVPSG